MRKNRSRIAWIKELTSLCIIGWLLIVFMPSTAVQSAEKNQENSAEDEVAIGTIEAINQEDSNVYINLSSGEGMKISFLKENLFRLHLDPEGNFPEYPTPNSSEHTTTIIDKNESEYKKEYGDIYLTVDEDDPNFYTISTNAIELRIEKETTKMSLYNKKTSEVLWEEAEPLKYKDNTMVQTLVTKDHEYFYGGGQQNGYYSHKNESINIRVGGGWDAGAASSPAPFYLSTEGYGVLRNTFKPGVYDFSEIATFQHNEQRFDAYYFVENAIPKVINEYTELTGKAALMPEYAFYLGHADCFNGTHNGRGDERTLMENGLNYLKDYVNNDMPLGWFLPNDGYSCGYGGLDNLENFVDAAKEENVVTGLWTQSDLYPDPNLPEDDPLRRDLDGEVKAGTRAIKTDVAWVGQGYSMALNATRQAAEGISKKENSDGARPFVVTVNGWAGTQRYSTLWSGDQYGGNWEYIRMHIPTYIGAGLSGNPNIGSDMDGIFGGDQVIQTRDFQWKAFTPIQIEMDGWAGKADEKNPWNYGEPYTSINRMYLKLKAEMMPYNYSIAEQSTSQSMPMVRGMMLEYPDDSYTYGTETQYQYMWGPNLLVAPVYKESDHEAGVRNGIYLPDEDQVWIDYFTGEQYTGGKVVHNVKAPLWKTPVFVKAGAIIPLAPENNSILDLDGSENRIFDIYPSGSSAFTMYEDDGQTLDYKDGKSTKTKITSETKDDKAIITVHDAVGNGYDGMVKNRGTEFIINTHQTPENISVKVGDKDIDLTGVNTKQDFEAFDNVYFYDEAPNLNKYATEGSEFAETEIITTPKLHVKVEKTDITTSAVTLTIDGFSNTSDDDLIDEEVPEVPTNLRAVEDEIKDNAIKLEWDKIEGENVQYDVRIDGVIHSNVFTETEDGQVPSFIHSDLKADTDYTYEVRATNTKGASVWSEEVTVRTKLDRFRNVPKNITATANSHQPGAEAGNAVDGDEGTGWHTEWNTGNQLPHTFEIDMKLAYDLEKFEYVPRMDAGNGTILTYDLDVSLDGKTYKNIVKDGKFERNNDTKTIPFEEAVYARYIKLTITDAVGGFGSAQEFRPYKRDKTEGWIVGKNISDGTEGSIGEDDLNFFASYMGVDETDTAWNQVMRGDINYNGVIDAYDLMYVAGQLGETPLESTGKPINGTLDIRPSKLQLNKGEAFTVDILGNDVKDMNAFSLELLVDSTKYKLIEIDSTEATKHMLDYSIRNGNRIMVAFSNKGAQKTLEGTKVLASMTLEAREDTIFDTSISRSMLLNTSFNSIETIGDILAPDEEPEEPRREVVLTNNDMTISGDGEKMQGGAAAFDKLIDGDIQTLAELIWTTLPEQEEEGASLPLNVQFKFNKPQELTKFEVYNRPEGLNGRIKKLQATATDTEGKQYDLGAKSVDEAAEFVTFYTEDLEHIPNGTMFNQIDIVFEASHVGHPRMLSIAEVMFTAYEQIDKTELEALIAKAEDLRMDEYTEESISVLQEKLEEAKGIVADDASSQEEIDRALAALQVALEALEEKDPAGVDKSQLHAAITQAEKVDLEHYTESSVNTFLETLSKAQNVAAKESASQVEVDKALEALLAAMEALVDVKALQEIIDEAQAMETDRYTEASVAVLEEKLAAAITVLENSEATQEEVGTAIIELQYAMEDLQSVGEPADKTALKQLIEEAEEMDRSLYTKETIDIFEEKLADARVMLEEEGATQAEVNLATRELQAAIENLKEIDKNVDKSVLKTVIEEVKTIESEKYTEASVAALLKQLEVAQTVAEDKHATQLEVDEALEALEKALEALVEKQPEVDTSELEALIAEAEALNMEGYTEASVTAFKEKLHQAKAVVADKHASQKEVDEALEALEKARKALVERQPEVDTSELEALIAEAEALNMEVYTEASVITFKEMLYRAKSVAGNEKATQSEVDAALKELQKAIANLEKIESQDVDKSALVLVMEIARGIDTEKYTTASVQLFLEALAQAKKVMGDNSATQKDVDHAETSLQNALDRLEKRRAHTSKEEDYGVSGSDPSPKGEKLPETATPLFNWMVLGMLLSSLGVISYMVYKRKRLKE